MLYKLLITLTFSCLIQGCLTTAEDQSESMVQSSSDQATESSYQQTEIIVEDNSSDIDYDSSVEITVESSNDSSGESFDIHSKNRSSNMSSSSINNCGNACSSEDLSVSSSNSVPQDTVIFDIEKLKEMHRKFLEAEPLTYETKWTIYDMGNTIVQHVLKNDTTIIYLDEGINSNQKGYDYWNSNIDSLYKQLIEEFDNSHKYYIDTILISYDTQYFYPKSIQWKFDTRVEVDGIMEITIESLKPVEIACPQYSAPPEDWCDDGVVIPQGLDEYGCQQPGLCETACSAFGFDCPSWCKEQCVPSVCHTGDDGFEECTADCAEKDYCVEDDKIIVNE
ncbi:MAG: hypothetical protein OCC49_13835 [Fibrobacterales bacterium]